MKRILFTIMCLSIIHLSLVAQSYCEDFAHRTYASFEQNPSLPGIYHQSWVGDGAQRVQLLKFDIGNKKSENIKMEPPNCAGSLKFYEVRVHNETTQQWVSIWKKSFTTTAITFDLNELPSSFTNPANADTDGFHRAIFKFYKDNGKELRRFEFNYKFIPPSDDYYEDNYGNTMTVWKSGKVNAPAVVTSEGVDFHDIRPSQYYWRLDGERMFGCLLDAGFDVYILDYDRGQADLKHNAQVFQYAVRKVAADVGKDVIAAGFSMGGVINRYACAKQEDIGNPLPITHMISLDAPQQGAVVNRDLQEAFYYGEEFLETEIRNSPLNSCGEKNGLQALSFAMSRLKSKTAKQLLVHNRYNLPTASTQSAHTLFYNELNALNGDGYPKLAKTVAVSFGTTTQEYSAGSTTARFEWNSGWGSLQGNAGDYRDNIHGYGQIHVSQNGLKYKANILNDAEAAQPGSSFPEASSLIIEETNILNQFGFKVFQLGRTTFMPITSTLDLTVPNDPNSSKFDEVIYSASTNPHDNIPTDIGTELLIEMLIEDLILQNQTIYDQRDYFGRNSITARNYYISTGGDVTMRAGNFIRLEQGFKVKPGSYFYAGIDDGSSLECGDDLFQGKKQLVVDEATSTEEIKTIGTIVESTQESTVSVSPNPFTNQKVKIDIEATHDGMAQIILHSIDGKPVKVIEWAKPLTVGAHSIEFDATDLLPGIYILETQLGSQIFTRKVVKQ